MRLFLLLAFIASRLKKAVNTDGNFKKFLMGHECTIVIKTNDGKIGKRFIFKDETFSTDNVLDQFDAAMIWADAKTGFKSMAKGEDGIKEAIRNHVVVIEGKLQSFTWFGAALNYVLVKPDV